MKSSYTFPCLFSYEGSQINVSFPDLPGCFTYGNSEVEAFRNARAVLEGFLYAMEIDNDDIPAPSKIKAKITEKDEVLTLVSVLMGPVRDEMENKHIKKTLTLPKWLNDIAVENNVNFSRLLQTSLKKYLDISRT